MKRILTICTVLSAASALASQADAGMIFESELAGEAVNNSVGTAESIADSLFTVDPSGDIFSAADGGLSGTALTATIVGELGLFSNDIDVFRFDMFEDGFAWFDVDAQFMQFATLQLFDAAGTLIARDQNSSFGGSTDSGSLSFFDPFIGEVALTAGTYSVAISEGTSFATGGGSFSLSLETPSFGPPPADMWSSITGATIGDSSFTASGAEGDDTQSYHLHVSQLSHVSEPSSLVLLAVGAVFLLGALFVARVR